MNKSALRAMVRGTYALQKERIQIDSRIIANYKARLGQEPSKKEDTLDEEGKKILERIRFEYKRMTDGLIQLPKKGGFRGTELIADYVELCLVNIREKILAEETGSFQRLEKILEDFPIYSEFLKGVTGCGPAISGIIISEIDIRKAKYPSSLWKYAGLDVVIKGVDEDGNIVSEGRGRKRDHLVTVQYTNSKGEQAERFSITFNPFLKTKLLYVLGASFLKTGNETYSGIYYDYKHRLENHDKYKDVSKGRRHNMALRYTVKQFLVDLHIKWRELEGLPVSEPYSVAKLGKSHRRESTQTSKAAPQNHLTA